MTNARQTGFTLIEIVLVLVVLGILSTVALWKYFDLQDQADNRAALSAAAEMQSRIHTVHANALLSGKSCIKAREEAAAVSKPPISDTDGDARIGDYYFDTRSLLDSKTTVRVSRTKNFESGMSVVLVLPDCGDECMTVEALRSQLDAAWDRAVNDFINPLQVGATAYSVNKTGTGDYFSAFWTNNSAWQSLCSDEKWKDYWPLRVGTGERAVVIDKYELTTVSGATIWVPQIKTSINGVEYPMVFVPSSQTATQNSIVDVVGGVKNGVGNLNYAVDPNVLFVGEVNGKYFAAGVLNGKAYMRSDYIAGSENWF